jgi:ribose 5-phosphate isomerase A
VSDERSRQKERAGRHAAALVQDGMGVGLGTGSTVRFALVALAERRLDIACVATSRRTEELAAQLGLRLVPPDGVLRLDLAIDGADEVDPQCHLIKGGGGAHAREKIVAAMADRFIAVVDDGKRVERLGAFGVPLEVLSFAPGFVEARLRASGALRVTRRGERSDNGNLLMDAHFGPIDDPPALAQRLCALPGIVEHGIFPAAMVERVVVGTADGVCELFPPGQGAGTGLHGSPRLIGPSRE